jgi:hypothetical protein
MGGRSASVAITSRNTACPACPARWPMEMVRSGALAICAVVEDARGSTRVTARLPSLEEAEALG